MCNYRSARGRPAFLFYCPAGEEMRLPNLAFRRTAGQPEVPTCPTVLGSSTNSAEASALCEAGGPHLHTLPYKTGELQGWHAHPDFLDPVQPRPSAPESQGQVDGSRDTAAPTESGASTGPDDWTRHGKALPEKRPEPLSERAVKMRRCLLLHA